MTPFLEMNTDDLETLQMYLKKFVPANSHFTIESLLAELDDEICSREFIQQIINKEIPEIDGD